jgi:thiamine-monophosphate kinase
MPNVPEVTPVPTSQPSPTGEAEAENTLAGIGEFGLIARLTDGRPSGQATLLGPGDDAAVLAASDGRVVACTDVLVAGVHFRLDWSSPEQIGRKAAAANLADVAAMGAVPTGLLVGLACPADLPVETISGLTDGLWVEARSVGVGVVGGDVASSPTLVVAVTALGSLEGRDPVTRSGARPGDTVALAGRVGWAAAGWAVLARGFRSPAVVVSAHRVPEPPYAAGPQAAEAGDVRTAALVVPDRLVDVGAALGIDPMHWLLTGGEDHALAATFPGDVPEGWITIGTVAEGEPEVLVDGRVYEGGPAGWDHFGR